MRPEYLLRLDRFRHWAFSGMPRTSIRPAANRTTAPVMKPSGASPSTVESPRRRCSSSSPAQACFEEMRAAPSAARLEERRRSRDCHVPSSAGWSTPSRHRWRPTALRGGFRGRQTRAAGQFPVAAQSVREATKWRHPGPLRTSGRPTRPSLRIPDRSAAMVKGFGCSAIVRGRYIERTQIYAKVSPGLLRRGSGGAA